MKTKYLLSSIILLILIVNVSLAQKNKLPEGNRAIVNEARFKLNSKVGKDWKFVGTLLKKFGAKVGDKSLLAKVKPGDICITNGYKTYVKTEERDYWHTVQPMVGVIYKVIDAKIFQIITCNDDKIAYTSEWNFSNIDLEGGRYYVKFLRPERGIQDIKQLKIKAPN